MDGIPPPILEAPAFEKASRVNASVLDDPFYQPPPDSAKAAPGSLLKVEKDIDTNPYLIPGGTALSKFMYQSEKLSGSPVPVSGYILWPYAARSQSDGFPIVAWATGPVVKTQTTRLPITGIYSTISGCHFSSRCRAT